MLEVYYKFFNKFCDVKTFGELEMDTDSMYLAVVEKEQEHCIWLDLKTESKRLRSKECSDSFTAGPSGNLCPRMFYDKHKKHDKRDSGLFKDEFRWSEMLCICSKTYSCYNVASKKFKFSSKCFNKRMLEESADGPWDNYRCVLDEKINIKSTNRGFSTNNHTVGTYEQLKKGLFYCYPKWIVESDGNHTQPLIS